jgi:superfamily II DNA or RNA helicase
MAEIDLLNRIADLESQILALTAENERLKNILGIPLKGVDSQHSEPLLFADETKNKDVEITNSINKLSPPEEKIKLFMSLFRGRTDVYAKRCYSKNYGSAYYIPACKNEWKAGLCNRPKVRCKLCKNRELSPLTEAVIDAHLRNKDENGAGIVGIYPLLPDETCLFLAVDFDEAEWQKDVSAFRLICIELHIPVAVERSRSGNGAHAWFIFSEPVTAIDARKFGNALLTKAMIIRHELKFSSYDRMFPNQDFMPKGGFGSLIALPLQGGARKNGNSEFIDENFQSSPDQWAYLASVKKISPHSLKQYNSILCEGDGLGQLGILELSEEERQKPWEIKKPESSLFKKDFPEQLTVVEASRLYIPKTEISQRALNRIKRLVAFSNPQFYKIQKMRMSTYGIPRIICSAYEDGEYLGIPRGCKSALMEILDNSMVNYCFEDKRNKGKRLKIKFIGTLREEQQNAANALLEHENGVLSVPTAFGKTVIGVSLIANRKCNTLILVHLQTLLEQWKKSLQQFLCFRHAELVSASPDSNEIASQARDDDYVGQIGASKNNATNKIDIAIFQSLIHNDEVDERVKNYGMVIVDECHHVPSANYDKVLSAVNAKYVYGLTATPIRQDGLHPLIFMQCGAVRYVVDAKSQAAKRDFDHYLIPCFTGFKKPFSVDESEWHITQIYSAIAKDEYRNQQIVSDAITAINSKRTPIILTQRKEHVAKLSKMLKDQCDATVITLTGTATAKQKQSTMASLANTLDSEPLIVVATGKYVGEGFDYPRLDTLLLASPIAWKGTLAQYAGRLHRDYQSKTNAMIYDYVDIHIPVLERMYHKRLTGYSQIGYKVLSSINQSDKINLIYNAKNFMSVLQNDFANAHKEIIIVSPYLRKKRVETVLEWLKTPLNNGAAITIITCPPESYKNKYPVNECFNLLQSASLKIIQKPSIHQKFILIDSRLVWYGSINLLSLGSPEESMMRLDSRELVAELESTSLSATQMIPSATVAQGKKPGR